MLTSQRILFSDNGTISDKTRELNDLQAGTFAMTATTAEDYLYIGTQLPTTHRYFEISSANSTASSMTVEIWDGSSWNAAVDVIDETSDGTNSFAQSGWVRFRVDRNESWAEEDTTEDVTGLTTVKVYQMHWFRISWDATITATIDYAGYKFSRDTDLAAKFPDLNSSSVKDAFESSKTDWNEQHFLAAEEIIRDLRKDGILTSPDQLLDPEQLTSASVYWVAAMIYNSFGDEYAEHEVRAMKKAREQMNLGIYRVDRDGDGHLDEQEIYHNVGLVRR